MVQGKPKIVPEFTENADRTPNSSEKSTTTTADSTQSNSPGCRRDANCNCEICVASINATLDLMPQSIHGRSRTNVSKPRRKLITRSPVSFPSPEDVPTPKSTARTTTASRPSDSSGSANFEDGVEKEKSRLKLKLNSRVFMVRFLLGLLLACGAEYGFSAIISRVLRAQLSPDLVQILGQKSWEIEGLHAKFVFLEKELEAYLGNNEVASCSSDHSLWKINQDGLLLHSKCTLYTSMAEEVSIWGWPLQTSGIFTSGCSSRSLSIIFGSLEQWISWERSYVVRNGNVSWTQGKWSSLVVQMDSNTWILDYRRSFLLENAGLISGTVEFLKLKLTTEFERLVQGLFWLSSMSEFRDHPESITGRSVATAT